MFTGGLDLDFAPWHLDGCSIWVSLEVVELKVDALNSTCSCYHGAGLQLVSL